MNYVQIKKSGFGSVRTQPQNGPHIALEHLETFGGRQRQHPTNERQVDAVLAIGWRIVSFAEFLAAMSG
jgi:hypothetical protein